jgi:hypothetical protein
MRVFPVPIQISVHVRRKVRRDPIPGFCGNRGANRSETLPYRSRGERLGPALDERNPINPDNFDQMSVFRREFTLADHMQVPMRVFAECIEKDSFLTRLEATWNAASVRQAGRISCHPNRYRAPLR